MHGDWTVKITSTPSQVFRQLEKLPILSEFEKANLKIYKPSFTKQELNYETANFNALGRWDKNHNWKKF